jgi:hypothetical protein
MLNGMFLGGSFSIRAGSKSDADVSFTSTEEIPVHDVSSSQIGLLEDPLPVCVINVLPSAPCWPLDVGCDPPTDGSRCHC